MLLFLTESLVLSTVSVFLVFTKACTVSATTSCLGKPIYAISIAIKAILIITPATIIPIFFHKIKVDPAVASGPLITTVNDLVAVVTYYGLAGLLLVGHI